MPLGRRPLVDGVTVARRSSGQLLKPGPLGVQARASCRRTGVNGAIVRAQVLLRRGWRPKLRSLLDLPPASRNLCPVRCTMTEDVRDRRKSHYATVQRRDPMLIGDSTSAPPRPRRFRDATVQTGVMCLRMSRLKRQKNSSRTNVIERKRVRSSIPNGFITAYPTTPNVFMAHGSLIELETEDNSPTPHGESGARQKSSLWGGIRGRRAGIPPRYYCERLGSLKSRACR
jgi:hypothetical protein